MQDQVLEIVDKLGVSVSTPLLYLAALAVAVLLFILGVRNSKGGVLGEKDKSNEVDEDREEEIGEEDSKGITQEKTQEVDTSIVSTDKVVYIDSFGENKSVELPDGIDDHDVDVIIVQEPEVTNIEVKNTTKKGSKSLLDIIKKYSILFMFVLFIPSNVLAESVAVDREDLDELIDAARNQDCLEETPPSIKVSPNYIFIDDEKRVYTKGPRSINITWCNYEIKATLKDNTTVLNVKDPTWGFRLRPKAYVGSVPTQFLSDDDKFSALEAGMMLDFFYVTNVNLNVFGGFNDVGAGLGLDLTGNFGLYLGWSYLWRHKSTGPSIGVYFEF